jgi:hypothetical protein
LVGVRGHHLFVNHIGRRFEAASVAVAHREASDAASPNAGSSKEPLLGSAVCRLAREFERYAGGAQADAKISEEAGRQRLFPAGIVVCSIPHHNAVILSRRGLG